MSLPFLEEVENCATALAGHRAAILFNLNLEVHYDFLECEFGYGPVVPCRICHGSKVVGMVTYNEGHEKRNRIDSDIYNLHKVLENSYLEALYEAKDIFFEIINER